jgi:Fe-S-cluster-containing dehydrogenase component
MAYENYGLLVDYRYCSNCHTCEVACKFHLQQTLGKEIDLDKTPGIVVLEKGPFHLEEGNPDAWDWSYIPVPTALCDLCADRLDRGEKPACVKQCLAACMEIGPLDELAKRATEIGRKTLIIRP